MKSNILKISKFIVISLFLVSIQINLITSNLEVSAASREKFLSKLKITVHESEAVKLLNEMVYQNLNLSDSSVLNLMNGRRWLKAYKLVLDFLSDVANIETQKEIENILEKSNNYVKEVKSLLKNKKKNIVRISPIFEWSQDNEIIKIRLKFAKNLESPGEKDIQNFKVICKRSTLIVHGYKIHEDYVANYYRSILLYDMIKHRSCSSYKETDGTYIIKFYKNQATLYWNHLDLFTEDHSNMYTWFDVFTQYDDKAKYTEFREFTQQNLLEKDINEYIQEKSEEKKLRLKKIKSIMEYFKTKDYENKNYCNSPVNEKFCFLVDIYEWNYWLS